MPFFIVPTSDIAEIRASAGILTGLIELDTLKEREVFCVNRVNPMEELALILVICLLGEGIAALLPVAFPASVISMVLLMFLLLCGAVKERQIQVTSKFLVANMGIFFVPAVVGTIEYAELLSRQLLPFVVIVLVTTPVVYGITAWTVQLLMRRMRKEDGQDD